METINTIRLNGVYYKIGGGGGGSSSGLYVLDGKYVMNQAIDLEPYQNKFWEGWFEMFGCFYRGVYVTDAGRGLSIYTISCDNTHSTTSGFPEEMVQLYERQTGWYNDEYELVFFGDVVPEWLYRLVTENGEKVTDPVYVLNGSYYFTIDDTVVYEVACGAYGITYPETDVDFIVSPTNSSNGYKFTHIKIHSDGDPLIDATTESGEIVSIHCLQFNAPYVDEWGGTYFIFNDAVVPEWFYNFVTEYGEEQ